MPSRSRPQGALAASPAERAVISTGEKPAHFYQKEDNLEGLQKEPTVLGIIQILCCVMISSLGVILVFAPYSPHFSTAVSTIVTSGYPFVGSLSFAITGVLSIISGKKSSKPFALSSLVSNALSALAAGVGLFFLGHSLGAVGALSRQCDSEKEHLPSLPYASYYHSIAEVKNCLLAGVSLTGMLVVMLAFTVLELLLATYASVFWWKQVYSSHPGVYFLRLSHKIIPSMSKRALQGQGYE
ncbi:PREDICTED: membrane-spanning 4-domains subfamily A member 7 isoform X1 [Condylura cristata]|uniref:membrane-spanning 4-domains subfamily A member 7 isoform X1 n=1 Tax=Condylura cristata TaxID=143302 RepID=UPI0006439F49|nr:PREDICTED: membrane-spanning 4-domains subfamily A member 7 isoform X1 [Condylura cristata]